MTHVCCGQSPCPCGRPLLIHASIGDVPTLKSRSGSVSVGPLGPGAYKVLFEPSKNLWQIRGLILNVILPPAPWKKIYDQPRQYIKKQRHNFANKGLSSQSYCFSSSHVWMTELNHKESWTLKNWCFWTVVLEKTLESPLDCKEIKPVNLKGNQSWIFTGRNDAEAEAPILWPPDAKNWLIKRNAQGPLQCPSWEHQEDTWCNGSIQHDGHISSC